MTITRTFDIIGLNCEQFPRNDMFAGKTDGKWVRYSPEDVKKNVDWFSYGLMSLGFRKGDKIATISPNKAEWSIIDHSLAQTGLIHVPVYPTISSEEYSYILDHSEVSALIVGGKSLYNKVKPVASRISRIREIISIDELEGIRSFRGIIEEGKRSENRFSAELDKIRSGIKSDDLLTIIYTSGTTGNPKGVMLSHSNLISNALSTAARHHIKYGNRAISFLPLCHVLERMMNYHFQLKGISIYYVDNMGTISEVVREVKPHIFNAVPRVLEKIYDNIINTGRNLPLIKKIIFFRAVRLGQNFRLDDSTALYRLRLSLARKLIFSKWMEAMGGELQIIVSGGAALQSGLEKVLWAAGISIIQGYGLTETSPVISVNPVRKGEIKLGTVGKILDEVETKISDDGEILCKGPNVMMGYYKDPQLTSQVIDNDGWFHTGDIGILDEQRYLRITDRKKEMFKLSAGKYIAPQAIENKLKESPFIEQVMVIGENQKFAGALISPDFTFLHDWCSRHRILFRDNSDLVENHEVLENIGKEVKEVNKTLSEHEQIKKFRLVTDEWTPQTGELSQTLKLKRNLIRSKYKSLIDEIYQGGEKDPNVLLKHEERNQRHFKKSSPFLKKPDK